MLHQKCQHPIGLIWLFVIQETLSSSKRNSNMIICMAKEQNLEKTVILHSTHHKTLSLPGRPSNNTKKRTKYIWKFWTLKYQKQNKFNNLFIRNYFPPSKMVESKGHILMIKLCLVLKILCSLINLCWMHFPFSEMLLSPESTAEAMEHYKPDFRVKCFTQSCLGGLLHQNSLPPSLRITQVPWGFLCAPSPRVMWCWIWVLSLVWLGGAQWRSCLCMMGSQATFSAHLRAFMVCSVSWIHEIISMECSWWSAITKWLQELESSWEHTSTQKTLKQPDPQTKPLRAADTQLWCWQPRWCFFSPSSTLCCIGWYNDNWAGMGTQTALLCWDHPAQVHSQVQPCCVLSHCCWPHHSHPTPTAALGHASQCW